MRKLLYFLKIPFFTLILTAFFLTDLNAQATRYWSTQLNEESSMLAGAVVGGSAGIGAIYYNPALISDNIKSSLSLNASLFSIEFNRIENALGNNIDLKHTRFFIQPRFLSYVQKSKKHEGLSYQFIAMSKHNFLVNFSNSQDIQIDILEHLPGNERYFTNFKYRNRFNEFWLGGGASYKVKSGFSVGISMFGMVKSLQYNYQAAIDAHPLSDTVHVEGNAIPFYTASTSSYEYVKFDDFRLMWKIGFAYSFDNINIGLNITTPSVHIFSDGETVSKSEKQSNIMNPDGSGFFPNYFVADEQIKNDIKVNYKDPLSIALGVEYNLPSGKQHFYLTMEYFFGIEPYKFIESTVNPNIAIPSIYQNLIPKDWLSYVSGARPVTNLAIGYKWQLSDHLLLLSGFRTDFSYLKNFDFGEYKDYNNLEAFNFNVYHLTGGVLSEILGHNIFAGLQYSFGGQKNMTQIINLSDPVEYNETEGAALQGDRKDNMKYRYHGLSLFLGVTFNFGNDSSNKDSN